jgi:hypothetical protein
MSKQKLPNIPAQKPPAQLPPATSGQLPAVAKATHPIRALKDFAAKADELAEHYGELKRASRNIQSVRQFPHQGNAQKYLDEAGALLENYHDEFRELARGLRRDLAERFDPESAYDDECLLEERVRAAIALLLASFPNANPGNPEAYVGMMVEEVMAEDDVSLVVLESACSQIRKTSKFSPTTAEVIEAIREQAELWEPRLNAIHGCGNVVGLIRNELKAATELVAAAKAEREQRRIAAEKKRADDELRAQPLKAGDRVRHKNVDDPRPGTILGAIEGGFHVYYDSDDGGYVLDGSLVRMIPGDSGFEIVEAQRGAVEKRLTEYRSRQQRIRHPVEFAIGDRVTHGQFGPGTVESVDGGMVAVMFDAVGRERVVDSFLERAE